MRLTIAALAFALALQGQKPPASGTAPSTATTTCASCTTVGIPDDPSVFVAYIDETGQTVAIPVWEPVEKPVEKPTRATEPLDFAFRANSAEPYMRVDLNEDYTPKSIMVRVDGKEIKMPWAEFEATIRIYAKSVQECRPSYSGEPNCIKAQVERNVRYEILKDQSGPVGPPGVPGPLSGVKGTK